MNQVWTEPKRHPDCSEPCVSELALDQLFCGELPDNDAEALRSRIGACAGCQARWNERSQGLNAFPELDADALVAKIHVGLAEASPAHKPRPEGWLTWLFGVKWAGAAAIATLAVVFVLPENEPKAPELPMSCARRAMRPQSLLPRTGWRGGPFIAGCERSKVTGYSSNLRAWRRALLSSSATKRRVLSINSWTGTSAIQSRRPYLIPKRLSWMVPLGLRPSRCTIVIQVSEGALFNENLWMDADIYIAC